MSLLSGPTSTQRFAPKNIKFSNLYKFGTKGQSLSGSVLNQAKDALAKAGYDQDKITKIITKDTAVTSKQMAEIASHLNKSGVYGFHQSSKNLIQGYMNKERVKAQSIAMIRKEHIMEARQEDINAGPKGIKSSVPSSPKRPTGGMGLKF